ncbi:hypothetical protein M9H77_11757 [Catharanthus roseus]|uniref:Uncharacterized protein n=1 Tax=Catharanthus roseus TaxID=4058 RepID=A0ACC0BFN2_CATRO|nr:hypothetical protein M9H77_11757 [Catharanthus roseus]
MIMGYYDNYDYGGYNYRRSSQTLGTTSRSLSYNNLKLPLVCGTLGPYDYEASGQKRRRKVPIGVKIFLMRSMFGEIVNVKIEEEWEINQLDLELTETIIEEQQIWS